MKLISSRENPEFKKLYRLATDARESRKQGHTLIDGPHLVGTYQQQVGSAELLLVSESAIGHIEIQALIEAHAGWASAVLKDSLFKLLSGVESPVGIAAVIPIPPSLPPSANGSCVVLDAVQDAGNVGSILRSSAAAGVRDVYMGPGCAGAWSPRVMRAAQGAHFRLRIREQADLATLLQTYRGKSYATVVLSGELLPMLDLSGDVAWLFGNEGQGVRPELVRLATQAVTIPMAAETESLNVAAAAAICLFAQVSSHHSVGGGCE